MNASVSKLLETLGPPIPDAAPVPSTPVKDFTGRGIDKHGDGKHLDVPLPVVPSSFELVLTKLSPKVQEVVEKMYIGVPTDLVFDPTVAGGCRKPTEEERIRNGKHFNAATLPKSEWIGEHPDDSCDTPIIVEGK